jgi:hypothetical protein
MREKHCFQSRQKILRKLVLTLSLIFSKQTFSCVNHNEVNLSPNCQTFLKPKNRLQRIHSASQCSLAGRYDTPIPTRFLALHRLLKNSSSVQLANTVRDLSERISSAASFSWLVFSSSSLFFASSSSFAALSLFLIINTALRTISYLYQSWVQRGSDRVQRGSD